jgi:iron complex outermembrane receptor protein
LSAPSGAEPTGVTKMVVKSSGASRRVAAGLTLTAAAALMWNFAGVAPAAAQQAVETVEITGSRIKNPNVESPAPIATMSAEDIAATKATSVEDVLTHMGIGDFSGGFSANSNNSGSGSSVVGLRNLGSARTLVLVNGQRYVSTDFQQASTAVDLNNIPMSMIDHIEVLKDGASSVYGADAIGGVINIITKSHATGVTADSYIGGSEHGDGFTWSLDSTMGANSDRGNLLVAVGADSRDPIKQTARDWSKNLYIGTSAEGGNLISSRLPVPTSGSTAYLANGQTVNLHDPNSANLIPNTVYLPGFGKTYYNLDSYPLLQGSLDRKQLNMTGHYDLTDDVTAIVEGFYTDRNSQEQLNPEPLASSSTTALYPGLVIPASNPYNHTGQNIPINWRSQELGPRVYKDDVQTYRTRFGLTGTAFKDYDWEVGYVYGQSDATYRVDNSVNYYHLGQLTGQFACDNAPGCSQGNFFNGVNTLTSDQANYLKYTDTHNSQLVQRYGYANFGGPVYQLPAGAIKGSVGIEQRTESEWDHPDSVRSAGQGDYDAAPTQGAYHVFSSYGELAIPILKNLPGAQEVSATLSMRDDDYSNFGQRITWKGGLNYQITEDIRLRGGYGKGIRAPSVKELYAGKTQGYITANNGDPCDTAKGTAGGGYAGSATCVAALKNVGINPTTYQSELDQTSAAPQMAVIDGGNTALKPETAHTATIGTVLTPRFIPHLSVATDYYSVHIKDAIMDGGYANSYLDTLLAQCYGPAQNTGACNMITRSTVTGDIGTVQSPNTNFGYERMRGIDWDVNYDFKAEDVALPTSGMFNISAQVNYLISDVQELPGGATVKQQGTFSSSVGEPQWKGILGVDYHQDDWGVHWDTRYIGAMNNLANRSTAFGNYANEIFYHDISASYNLKDLAGVKSVKVTVGIDNLFDRDPPYISSSDGSNSLSAAGYDYTGRFFYMRLSAGF